jgi:hypothetical protein
LSKLQTNEHEDALLKLGRGDAEYDGDEDALLLAVEERTRPAAARSSWTTRTARDAGSWRRDVHELMAEMDHCGAPELKKNARNRKEKMQSMALI